MTRRIPLGTEEEWRAYRRDLEETRQMMDRWVAIGASAFLGAFLLMVLVKLALVLVFRQPFLG